MAIINSGVYEFILRFTLTYWALFKEDEGFLLTEDDIAISLE